MNPEKILPPPPSMQFLPKDHRGYVVPFFVAWIDGKPDFRILDPQKMRRCVHERLCWLCGGPLKERTVAYVIGPMCAINRTSAEPPSHVECGEYAAKVCPFLTMPKAQRREANVPGACLAPAGEMIRRNPGVALVWVTRDRLKPFAAPRPDGKRGTLFDVGEPIKTLWFAEGRPATRAEVLASIESGLPLLLEVAKSDREGALAELERRRVDAMQYLPAEAA
jgi:hypothetical protein